MSSYSSTTSGRETAGSRAGGFYIVVRVIDLAQGARVPGHDAAIALRSVAVLREPGGGIDRGSQQGPDPCAALGPALQPSRPFGSHVGVETVLGSEAPGRVMVTPGHAECDESVAWSE